jgi:glycosyltransferase involved in cell wall biosynthesis
MFWWPLNSRVQPSGAVAGRKWAATNCRLDPGVETMHLSIVIPTFNRANLLPQTIPALASQKTEGFTHEVIFVANGSSDETDSILKELVASAPGTFRYFWIEPTGGPSAPRNVGIRAASGEIVIILDDDVAPDPDLALRHIEFHRQYPDPQVAAIGKVYVPARLLDDPMSLFHSHYSYDRFNDGKRLSYFDFWTCNVSFKRQFMLDHGMFDERILMFEDIEVGHRLEAAGMELHYLPAATGQHLHKSDPASLTSRVFTIGSWLYRITEYIPGSMVRKRFGLVTTEFGPKWFVKRLSRLIGLLMLDNPGTRSVLRLLGATRSRRNRVTDMYYALVFRRAFLTGYYKTWFQAWRAVPRVGRSQTQQGD